MPKANTFRVRCSRLHRLGRLCYSPNERGSGVKPSNPLKKTLVYGSKEGSDISVMIDCKAVVEKKNFIATGLLTYAAGEIIEIEFPQSELFQLGEQVRIIVYTKSGIYVFESSILAKAQDAIIVINPPDNRKRFLDKREHPRVPVRQPGKVISIIDAIRKTEQKLEDPLTLHLDNISMTGVALSTQVAMPLPFKAELMLELDLGFTFRCRTEIVHKKQIDTGLIYGTRLLQLEQEHESKLRAYILRSQIETYYKEKSDKFRIQVAEQQKLRAQENGADGSGTGKGDAHGSRSIL